jgi:aryl-alcohol dehydrogenase-like predicted oxidoreductase
VLAIKVYQKMETGPNDRHLSAYHILIRGGKITYVGSSHFAGPHTMKSDRQRAAGRRTGRGTLRRGACLTAAHPVVTAAINGPRPVEQLRQNLKAPSLTLSRETLATLNEIWPGPCGEAPKAYAW